MKYKLKFLVSLTSICIISLASFHVKATPLTEERNLTRKVASINFHEKIDIAHEDEKENQENMSSYSIPQKLSQSQKSSLLKLKNEINELTIKIENAYLNASKEDLGVIYKAFRNLNYREKIWCLLGEQMKAKKWPSQKSGKEIVGGHLFFPSSRLHLWQESIYTEHLLQRSDILYGCTFAASFRHSLGLFYTTHILWAINGLEDEVQEEMEKNKSNFYTRKMEQACKELEQCLDRPDVCYALGQGCNFSISLSEEYIKMSWIELHEKGKDPKNKVAALNLKTFKRDYRGSPVEELLSFARQGYLPAYVQAAYQAKRMHQRDLEKSILEEAIKAGYNLAWLELAYWYYNHKQQEGYQTCLEKAAQLGVSRAFLDLGFNIVGNRHFQLEWEKLQKASPLEIKKAADYFLQAGQLHDPKGYDYLADLKFALSVSSQNRQEKESLRVEALEAAKQGCVLGWRRSFSDLARISTDDEYSSLLEEYGPSLDELPIDVEEFIDNEIGVNLPSE